MVHVAPKIVSVALGGVILSGVLAGSASAVSWGTLTASYDGKSRASAYGTFYNSGNTYAKNKILTKDLAADGNTIYSEMEFHWSSGAYDFGYHTPEHNHTYYVTNYLQDELQGDSNSVRGNTHVCVQLGFPVADRCSAWAQPSFSY
ncbi:hypothetical protein [Streptomyces eurythermus]|uniref:hypothetical protein n=1 Tax=Streptomyces eurythermus TaxID=42237 RepID=UPI0034092E13